ncbi:MAG: hypothetical protein PHH01_04845 [Patescibacteria group bacterium]|nr:hypothetical protein [Patescibacteria group bacterium]MDD5567494.1 hypothetical protein [Patescibacteria group bacterium]
MIDKQNEQEIEKKLFISRILFFIGISCLGLLILIMFVVLLLMDNIVELFT